MSQSITFDRAADFYDQTRSFPPGEERNVAAFLAGVGALQQTDRVLEIGVGTGRVALPLAGHVRAIVGIDLARAMMERLRAKQTTERILLAQADATVLPFAANTFDGAVAVHVFHLIPAWQQAVAEAARVLKPDAPLISTWSENFHQPRWWEAWASAIPSHYKERFGVDFKDQPNFLLDCGWQPRGDDQIHTYTTQQTPRQYLDGLQRRLWSTTWHLTDEELAAGVAAVRAVIEADRADLDAPQEIMTRLHARAFLPPK